MFRGLILGGVAFAVVFAAERQFQFFSKDVERYNRIRAMSGDPSLQMQGVEKLREMLTSLGQSRRGDVLGFVEALKDDAIRYARISTM